MYKWRHLIDNFFCKLKQFRRIATRYEKIDDSYSAVIHLVGTAIATRWMSTDLRTAEQRPGISNLRWQKRPVAKLK
jgi:hypothetical protein